jgi:hypothetical protein
VSMSSVQNARRNEDTLRADSTSGFDAGLYPYRSLLLLGDEAAFGLHTDQSEEYQECNKEHQIAPRFYHCLVLPDSDLR